MIQFEDHAPAILPDLILISGDQGLEQSGEFNPVYLLHRLTGIRASAHGSLKQINDAPVGRILPQAIHETTDLLLLSLYQLHEIPTVRSQRTGRTSSGVAAVHP